MWEVIFVIHIIAYLWFMELVMDREAWHAAGHWVRKGRTRLSGWIELNWYTINTSIWIQRKDNKESCYTIAVWFIAIYNKTEFLIFPKIWTKYICILKCNTKYYNKTSWTPKLKYHFFSLVMVHSIYMAL